MSILGRFADIMRSNINAILDKLEDPAKMVDQMLLDLRKDLAQVKKETAGIMADEKNAKRQLDECLENINRYTVAAQKALRAGNEGDARELIDKKQKLEKTKESLQTAYDVTHANAEVMQQMYNKLTADIAELEARKSAIQAKAAAAKAQERINDVVAGGPDIGASLEAFDRLENKVNKKLDAAQAEASLNAEGKTGDLADKYLAGKASVEEELLKMKAEMGL